MADRKELEFQADVIDIAIRAFQASVGGRDGERFLKDLYARYQAAGSPVDVRGWLKKELAPHFLCVSERPKWVEEEPAWPFFDGKPMVFVGQLDLPENNVTKTHLTWDTVLYVFGARIPESGGYRTEFRVVDQIRGFGGTGYD